LDALEILIFANALVLIMTLVFFGRALSGLVKAKRPSFAFTFRRRYAIALILTVVTITGVYGVTLFQHSFPATPSGTLPVISSTCTTLTLETAGMITGVPSTMLFNCGLSAAALTSSSSGPSTPTFTLPPQATSLSLVAHVNNALVCTGGSPLTSGTAHTFTSGESLDYCLASNSYPSSGIPTFTVAWSQ
jgi:hypothetical protein